MGASVLADLLSTSQSTSEVVITVSVIEGNRFMFQQSRTYYVRDDNLAEYKSNFPPPVFARVSAIPHDGSVRSFQLVDR